MTSRAFIDNELKTFKQHIEDMTPQRQSALLVTVLDIASPIWLREPNPNLTEEITCLMLDAVAVVPEDVPKVRQIVARIFSETAKNYGCRLWKFPISQLPRE